MFRTIQNIKALKIIGDSKSAPRIFNNRSFDALSRAKNVDCKNDDYERKMRIIEKCFGPDESQPYKSTVDLDDEKIIKTKHESTENENLNNNTIQRSNLANSNKLHATTNKESEEKLTQRVEKIEETVVVDPAVPSEDNQTKILGMKRAQLLSNTIRNSFTLYDKIAKRCLHVPINEIDDRLLEELRKFTQDSLAIDSSSYHIAERRFEEKFNNTSQKSLETINSKIPDLCSLCMTHTPEDMQKFDNTEIRLIKAEHIESLSVISPYDRQSHPINEYSISAGNSDPESIKGMVEEQETMETEQESFNLSSLGNLTVAPVTLDIPKEKEDELFNKENSSSEQNNSELQDNQEELDTEKEAPQTAKEKKLTDQTDATVSPQKFHEFQELARSDFTIKYSDLRRLPVNPMTQTDETTSYEEKMRMDAQRKYDITNLIAQTHASLVGESNTPRILDHAASRVNCLSNTAEGEIPLSEMLRKVRERSKQYNDECSTQRNIDIFRDRTTFAITMSKPPPCKPPPKKDPCPPCPPAKKDPCPPKKDPCAPKKKDPCAKFSSTLVKAFTKHVYCVKFGTDIYNDLYTYDLRRNYSTQMKINKELSDEIRNIPNEFVLKTHDYVDENIDLVRGFEPWSPIPSWPIPKKEKKRPLVCPKEGCKVIPPRPTAPCKPGPCIDFPKRTFSESNCSLILE